MVTLLLCPTWLSVQCDATSFKCRRLVINYGVGEKKNPLISRIDVLYNALAEPGDSPKSKNHHCTEDASEGFTSLRLGLEEEKKSRKK